MSYVSYTAGDRTQDISEMVQEVIWKDVEENGQIKGNILTVIFRESQATTGTLAALFNGTDDITFEIGPRGNAPGDTKLSGEVALRARNGDLTLIMVGKYPIGRSQF